MKPNCVAKLASWRRALRRPPKCRSQLLKAFAYGTFMFISQVLCVENDIWSKSIGNASSEPLLTCKLFMRYTSFFEHSFDTFPVCSSLCIFCHVWRASSFFSHYLF